MPVFAAPHAVIRRWPRPAGGGRRFRRLAACLALGAAVWTGAAAQAAAPTPPAGQAAAPVRLRIVGGLANVNQYTQHEEPFWARRLSALTHGEVQAEIVPFDRAGIRGQSMLRLLQLGVVPFGTALLSLTMPEDALLAAPDMAGISPDMATLRKVVSAFRPTLAQRLRERYDVELLAVYAYPAQVVFCQKAFAKLADLSGRRVRVSSVLQADLVEGLGATPVFTEFAELLPQMRSGALDCAITGTMSGHNIGLHLATTHLHSLAINWGLSVFAANASAWGALKPSLRQLLREQLPLLEQSIWAAAERDTTDGLACNSGQGVGAAQCTGPGVGHMTVVRPSPEDQQRLRQLVASTVLPRWIKRCGPPCADAWGQTLAPAVGLPAER